MIWLIKRKLISIRYIPAIIRDYYTYKKKSKLDDPIHIKKFFIIAWEKETQSADLNGFYFYQDLHVAQLIHKNNPEKHVDIGSRIDGFIAHIAAFREIELFDIRPMDSAIRNVIFKQADLMKLDPSLVWYTDSISSLSVLEHFWLWRYWDSIDVFWYLKWLENITKILKKGGKFYVSLPIWPQRVEFNAHRVFSMDYLVDLFEKYYNIDSFSYVDDKWNFYANCTLSEENKKNNFNCIFGNGIFELSKI